MVAYIQHIYINTPKHTHQEEEEEEEEEEQQQQQQERRRKSAKEIWIERVAGEKERETKNPTHE